MADTSGTPAPDTTSSPAKPVDSSVSRVKSESDEGGGRVRQASGGSQGSGGHKPKLYKQISTDSHGYAFYDMFNFVDGHNSRIL